MAEKSDPKSLQTSVGTGIVRFLKKRSSRAVSESIRKLWVFFLRKVAAVLARSAVKKFLDKSGPVHRTRHHSIQYRQGGLEEANREFDRLTGWIRRKIGRWLEIADRITATEDPLLEAALTASALHEPEDDEVRARLERLHKQAVADPLPDFPGEDGNHLSLGFLKERQWVAVPMESATFFHEVTLGYALRAFERVGDDRALAVQAEDLKCEPRYVEFRATPE